MTPKRKLTLIVTALDIVFLVPIAVIAVIVGNYFAIMVTAVMAFFYSSARGAVEEVRVELGADDV